MTGFELPVAFFLLANLIIALLATARGSRGATTADRMLIALLFGSAGVGILLLLAHVGKYKYLIDVALVLALLAAITGISMARRAWHKKEHTDA
jgi:multicomponent Na+:H+ antiporter subunit F